MSDSLNGSLNPDPQRYQTFGSSKESYVHTSSTAGCGHTDSIVLILKHPTQLMMASPSEPEEVDWLVVDSDPIDFELEV